MWAERRAADRGSRSEGDVGRVGAARSAQTDEGGNDGEMER